MSCLSRADQTRSRCPCSRSPPACYQIRPRRSPSLHTRVTSVNLLVTKYGQAGSRHYTQESYISYPACYRIRPCRFLSLHTRSYISYPACYQIRPRRSPSLHTRELQEVKYLILVRKHRFLSKLPSFIGPRTPDTSKTFIFISNEHQVFYTSQVAELGHPCQKLKKLIYISCLGRKKKI